MAPKINGNYIKPCIVAFFFLQLSNTRDVAVVTAGGLFGNHTQREHADALTLRASFRPC